MPSVRSSLEMHASYLSLLFFDNVKPSSPLFETIPGKRKYDFSFSLEARFPQLKTAQKLTIMPKKRFPSSTFPYGFCETLISGCPPQLRRKFFTWVTHVCDIISEQRIVKYLFLPLLSTFAVTSLTTLHKLKKTCYWLFIDYYPH